MTVDIRTGRTDFGIQTIRGYDGDHSPVLANTNIANNVVWLKNETDIQGVSRNASPVFQDPVSAGTRHIGNFDLLVFEEDNGTSKGITTRGLFSNMEYDHTSVNFTRDDTHTTPNLNILKPLLNDDEWAEHVQILRLFWRYDLPVVELLRCNITDPAAGQRVPIFVWLGGRVDNTKDNRLLRTDSGVDQQSTSEDYETWEDEPIRFYLKGLSFNIPVDAAEAMKSTYRHEFRLIKMSACRTLDSTMVNSQSGTMTWSSGSTITLDTDLMWRPRSVRITPITSDAVAFYDGYEWTGISDPLGDDEDARQPTLQINLNATPTTEDIQFAYWLDVSPY